MSKKKITKEKFIKYCYGKAYMRLVRRFLNELRGLRIPLTMKIMQEELNNFVIK